jgi:hypothetical protein
MSWQNSFKKDDSPLLQLSKNIFGNSLLCAESLKKDLEEKYGKDSKEFHFKYTSVLFGFMYFFLHLINRSAFRQLGHEKRNKLVDDLASLVVNSSIETLFGHWPKKTKDGIKMDFYQNFNSAEIEYGKCKELLLKPGDDTRILDKLRLGEKSKSIVGQLIDNLSQIIKGEININAIFEYKIMHLIIDILKKIEIDRLVLESYREIK